MPIRLSRCPGCARQQREQLDLALAALLLEGTVELRAVVDLDGRGRKWQLSAEVLLAVAAGQLLLLTAGPDYRAALMACKRASLSIVQRGIPLAHPMRSRVSIQCELGSTCQPGTAAR